MNIRKKNINSCILRIFFQHVRTHLLYLYCIPTSAYTSTVSVLYSHMCVHIYCICIVFPHVRTHLLYLYCIHTCAYTSTVSVLYLKKLAALKRNTLKVINRYVASIEIWFCSVLIIKKSAVFTLIYCLTLLISIA